MSAKAYNGSQVDVIVGNNLMVGGDEDEFVSLAFENPGQTMQRAIDGEVTFSQSSSENAIMTITLRATSAANALLSALYETQQATPGGAFVPCVVRDRSGLTLYTAAQCKIIQRPDPSFGMESGTRAWQIGMAKVVGAEGGN